MSSGPIMVFVLAKQNAVEEWKRLIGPATVLFNSGIFKSLATEFSLRQFFSNSFENYFR